jgi:hypothetical protein
VASAAAFLVGCFLVVVAAADLKGGGLAGTTNAATLATAGNAGVSAPLASAPPPSEPPASAPPTPPPPRHVPAPASAPPAATTAGAASSARHGPGILLSLAGGIDFFPQGPEAAATAQLALGVALTRRFELEARGVVGSSTTLGEAPNGVLRAERRVTLRASTWFETLPRIAVLGGVGAAFTRVRALDLDTTPVEVVWSPTAEAAVALELPLASRFSLRTELGCHALFVRENYVVNGDQSIGEGPALGCSLAVGATWSSQQPK